MEPWWEVAGQAGAGGGQHYNMTTSRCCQVIGPWTLARPRLLPGHHQHYCSLLILKTVPTDTPQICRYMPHTSSAVAVLESLVHGTWIWIEKKLLRTGVSRHTLRVHWPTSFTKETTLTPPLYTRQSFVKAWGCWHRGSVASITETILGILQPTGSTRHRPGRGVAGGDWCCHTGRPNKI